MHRTPKAKLLLIRIDFCVIIFVYRILIIDTASVSIAIWIDHIAKIVALSHHIAFLAYADDRFGLPVWTITAEHLFGGTSDFGAASQKSSIIGARIDGRR